MSIAMLLWDWARLWRSGMSGSTQPSAASMPLLWSLALSQEQGHRHVAPLALTAPVARTKPALQVRQTPEERARAPCAGTSQPPRAERPPPSHARARPDRVITNRQRGSRVNESRGGKAKGERRTDGRNCSSSMSAGGAHEQFWGAAKR